MRKEKKVSFNTHKNICSFSDIINLRNRHDYIYNVIRFFLFVFLLYFRYTFIYEFVFFFSNLFFYPFLTRSIFTADAGSVVYNRNFSCSCLYIQCGHTHSSYLRETRTRNPVKSSTNPWCSQFQQQVIGPTYLRKKKRPRLVILNRWINEGGRNKTKKFFLKQFKSLSEQEFFSPETIQSPLKFYYV